MAKKVLVVDDEKLIVKGIRFSLEQDGMEVDCAYDGEEALKMATENAYDMILLDIMQPDADGISILKKLRAAPATADIPVIMATAKGTEFDKVIGLDLGADDYLAKPFGMMEMVSRVKAVLRRVNHVPVAAVLTHKGISLNESSHQVFVDGKKIELTIKEYQLLRLFLKNPGVAFTRENLLSSVWESEFQGETRTVDVHIASLRLKLGSAGEAIKTVRGVGYRLEDAR